MNPTKFTTPFTFELYNKPMTGLSTLKMSDFGSKYKKIDRALKSREPILFVRPIFQLKIIAFPYWCCHLFLHNANFRNALAFLFMNFLRSGMLMT